MSDLAKKNEDDDKCHVWSSNGWKIYGTILASDIS